MAPWYRRYNPRDERQVRRADAERLLQERPDLALKKVVNRAGRHCSYYMWITGLLVRYEPNEWVTAPVGGLFVWKSLEHNCGGWSIAPGFFPELWLCYVRGPMNFPGLPERNVQSLADAQLSWSLPPAPEHFDQGVRVYRAVKLWKMICGRD